MSESEKKSSLKGIFILLLIFFVVFVFFAISTIRSMQGSLGFGEMGGQRSSQNAPIGVVEISGVILDSKDIIERLQMAEEDKSVKAIILRIDSPGGAVGPTQEVYQEVRRINQAGEKKVFASFGSVAASGGYYIGAAAEKIYASPGTLTGSIGVIMQFLDLSKLYDFAKISPEVVKAGKFKDIGSPMREMRPEERKLLTDLIDDVHEQFKEDIVSTREAKLTKNINELAQGQIFSGRQAFELGLVDELAGLWETARLIHTELRLEEDFDVRYIELKKKFSLTDFLSELEGKLQGLGRPMGSIPMLMVHF